MHQQLSISHTPTSKIELVQSPTIKTEVNLTVSWSDTYSKTCVKGQLINLKTKQ